MVRYRWGLPAPVTFFATGFFLIIDLALIAGWMIKFFDGCCENGIYDNMKTLVTKILSGKDRVLNQKFLQMMYQSQPVDYHHEQ